MLYKRLFFFLLTALTCTNIYIYLHRNQYTFVKQSSYNEIYPSYSTLTANSYNIISNTALELIINNPPAAPLNWVIKTDDSLYTNYSGIHPQITVPPGTHNFKVFNTNKDSFCFQAENLSTADYKKFNLTRDGAITVLNSDLLQNSLVAQLHKWKDNEVAYSKEEDSALAAILNDTLKIIATETTVQKIKKIGSYLGNALGASRGTPSDSLNNLSVFQQYKAAAAGAPVWCGNYAAILNLFALKAGIKTRGIEIGNYWGNLPGNVHVFNEYFIPEQGKWAAIDLTFNNVFYTDAQGNLLNAVQVKNTRPADTTVKVWKPEAGGGLHAVYFSSLEKSFFDLYAHTNTIKFYLSGNYNESNIFYRKFLRYFKKKYYYEVYSDNTLVTNQKFYLKQFLLALQFIFITAWLLLGIVKLLFNTSSKK